MKFFVISDDADAVTGMRLSGIEGIVVHDDDEAIKALERAAGDESVAVVLMTEGVCERCGSRAAELKQAGERPLIVVIPDRSGRGRSGDAIARYVREAVGIKL